jgi:hypothetical protein
VVLDLKLHECENNLLKKYFNIRRMKCIGNKGLLLDEYNQATCNGLEIFLGWRRRRINTYRVLMWKPLGERIVWRYVQNMEGGWNWFRILINDGLRY